MATFKFYIKGTDEKVRTSKTHHYTHYVAGQCCGSYMLAVKARDARVAARYPRETAEDIINGGYYKVCARNLEEAREHLDWHDEQFGAGKGTQPGESGLYKGLEVLRRQGNRSRNRLRKAEHCGTRRTPRQVEN